MPHNWLFCAELPQVGEACRLSDEEQRHCKVLRLQSGAVVTLVDGSGSKATAKLSDPATGTWIVEHIESVAAPPIRILRMPYLQGAKMDWVIEKATEFGASSIELFVADRGNAAKGRLDRFNSIVKAAAKQSGQAWWPQIREIKPIKGWHELEVPIYYGSLAKDAKPLSGVDLSDSFCWLCGPESGWSGAEEQCLQQLKATPIKLCSSTLRAETALIGGFGALVATLTTA